MNNSISFKLFTFFAIVLGAFVASIVLLNVFMLEKYYIFKSRQIFTAVAAEVTTVVSAKDDIQKIIEDIDRAEGISVIIADRELQTLYTSFPQKKENRRLPREIEDIIKNTAKTIKKNPVYRTIEKQHAVQPKVVYAVMTPEEQYLILTKPLKGIRESAAMANQFYVMVGLLVLIMGSFFLFRFSDQVTKPIVEMSQIAQALSELQFGQKIVVKSNDELSTLAQSINILSDKLEASIAGLKRDLEFQKNLSRNMAHELKTPIGVIKGYAEGLVFGVADNAEMRSRYVQTISGECDRMDALVNEMLFYSRLSAKDYVLTGVTEFSAEALRDDIMTRFDYYIKNNSITFVYDCDQPMTMRANYDLILRAVTNLVANAFRYCDEHKDVRLRVAHGEQIEITVFNSGSGIPENEQLKIFDEFYKIDKARSREGGGHGLGLPIVKSIALIHQGAVTVQNTAGGVEFIFTFSKNL